MSDLRNKSEKTVHELILHAMREFCLERMSPAKYQVAMAYLRDAERILLNRQYGCSSGKHSGSNCLCTSQTGVPMVRINR